MAKADPNALHKTGTPGIMYRGDDRNRRYTVTYRCFGTCSNPDHLERFDKGKRPQHWERSQGDLSDAKRLLSARLQAIQEKRAARQRGDFQAAAPERAFSKVTDEYLESRAFTSLGVGTQKKYRQALDSRILPRFGTRSIQGISTNDIAEFLDHLRKAPRQRKRGTRTHGLSESAINGTLSPLRAILNFAAERSRKYIAQSPLKADPLTKHELPNPETDGREVQALDASELERLFKAAGDDRLILEVKARTGQRTSELRALVWGDIDLQRKRIRVSRQIDPADKGERVELKDRSLSDERYVPLFNGLAEKLADHKARQGEHNLSEPGHFVFGGNEHVTHAKLDRIFSKAIKAAKIERHTYKRLSPHSLRHSFGSLLIANGAQLAAVSAWLGHKKVSTTEKWYRHQLDDMLSREAERMRKLESVPAPLPA